MHNQKTRLRKAGFLISIIVIAFLFFRTNSKASEVMLVGADNEKLVVHVVDSGELVVLPYTDISSFTLETIKPEKLTGLTEQPTQTNRTSTTIRTGTVTWDGSEWKVYAFAGNMEYIAVVMTDEYGSIDERYLIGASSNHETRSIWKVMQSNKK